jgi:hypothetical protein
MSSPTPNKHLTGTIEKLTNCVVEGHTQLVNTIDTNDWTNMPTMSTKDLRALRQALVHTYKMLAVAAKATHDNKSKFEVAIDNVQAQLDKQEAAAAKLQQQVEAQAAAAAAAAAIVKPLTLEQLTLEFSTGKINTEQFVELLKKMHPAAAAAGAPPPPVLKPTPPLAPPAADGGADGMVLINKEQAPAVLPTPAPSAAGGGAAGMVLNIIQKLDNDLAFAVNALPRPKKQITVAIMDIVLVIFTAILNDTRMSHFTAQLDVETKMQQFMTYVLIDTHTVSNSLKPPTIERQLLHAFYEGLCINCPHLGMDGVGANLFMSVKDLTKIPPTDSVQAILAMVEKDTATLMCKLTGYQLKKAVAHMYTTMVVGGIPANVSDMLSSITNPKKRKAEVI